MNNKPRNFYNNLLFRKDRLLAFLSLIIPMTLSYSSVPAVTSLQFPLFRIDFTNYGISIILIVQELNFVTSRMLLWVFGTGILISGVILSVLEDEQPERNFRKTGIVMFTAGIFFLLSMLVYNNGFNVIPLGIPMLFLAGGWLYMISGNVPGEKKIPPQESERR